MQCSLTHRRFVCCCAVFCCRVVVSLPVLCLSSECSYSGISLLQVCSHCNGHGSCWQGYCQCSEGFATTLLDNATTANASSGLVISDTLLSELADAAIRLNEEHACSLPSCPLDCSGNGQCQMDAISRSIARALLAGSLWQA